MTLIAQQPVSETPLGPHSNTLAVMLPSKCGDHSCIPTSVPASNLSSQNRLVLSFPLSLCFAKHSFVYIS